MVEQMAKELSNTKEFVRELEFKNSQAESKLSEEQVSIHTVINYKLVTIFL